MLACVTLSVVRSEAGVAQADLSSAIELVRSGARAMAVGTARQGGRVLLIELATGRPGATGGCSTGCAVRLGFAATVDGAAGTGADPRGLQPARAIRRALAEAGLKAGAVWGVWATFDPGSFPEARSRAYDTIALALGRHAPGVALDLRPTLGDGAVSGALANARAIRAVGLGQVEAAVAVSIGVDGRNTALALAPR